MAVSYATDVKPLFRERDRDAMISARAFDLWEYDDVVEWADRILDQVENGLMPCDAAWPSDKVDTFRQWISDGKQP